MEMSALTGKVVLDLTWYLPGPYCTMLLRSLGAEVWKVEPTAGEPMRASQDQFARLNWGKKSVALDVRRAEGKAIYFRLAKEADVVVEGFRPGVAKRLGIDYEAVKAVNPKAVYCSLSGYGQEGPSANEPGHDPNYQAVGGAMDCYARSGGPNASFALPLSDLSSGLFAAFAIASALVECSRTGNGTYVDISMTDTVFTWVALTHLQGVFNTRNLYPGSDFPHFGAFETKDGKLVALGLGQEDHLWRNFCKTVGFGQWAGLSSLGRIEMRDEIAPELRRVFRQKTRDEWVRILKAADVPATGVNTFEDAMADPQIVSRNLIWHVPGLDGAPTPVVRNPVLDPNTVSAVPGPSRLGQHTAEILERVGYSGEEIATLRAAQVV